MAIQSQMTSSNDLKMDGSSTNKAVVSDYLGYGSFSGADTKVIVHLPKSLRAQRQLQTEIAEIEERLKEATEVLFYGGGTRIQQKQAAEIQGDPDRLIAIYNELNFLESELANAKKNYNDYLTLPTTKVLGEIQTISWGTFREKSPVRTLGSVYPRAYTRGPRTIGGSMIFTIFYEHVFHELLKGNFGYYSTGTSDFDTNLITTVLPDQLPPLDISLVFANEYGAVSHMGLWGVEFVQEGGTFSIEDIFSENTVQYVCRDLDPMRLAQTAERENKGIKITTSWTKTASQMSADAADERYRNGWIARRNPFI